MRRLLAVLVLLLAPALTHAGGLEQTHSTVPSQNSSFITDLQNFLKREDAARYIEQFVGMVVSGGTDTTGGTLTHTPAAFTGYPGGFYVTETGSVTYTSNSTCWLIANKAQSGNLDNFVRSSGTHYLLDCTSPSKPALPADSMWLAEVVTGGSSVTTVTDLRTRVPYAGSYPLADLPAAGTRGRLALVTDVNSGTLYWDTGAAWRQVTLNPMSTAGDLIYGGTSGIPTRLAIGIANQLLGANATATAPEYKTLTAGDGVSVTHAVGTVTFSATAAAPSGALLPYAGTSAPSGWLLCDATAYTASTFPSLATILIPNASIWGRGTALGTFTVDSATDIVTLSSHGKVNGDILHVASTTSLPGGLSANTVYYVRDAAASTFRLAASSGGSAIDITSTGSGTHSAYDEFQVPDMRSRSVVGAGAGTFTSSFAAADIDTGTDVITVPSNTTLYTGQAVVLSTTGSDPGGLTSTTTYYIIRTSDTTILLASSLANALAGTDIDITSQGTGTHTLTQTLTTRTIGAKGGEEGHYLLPSETYLDDGTTHGLVQTSGTNGAGSNSTPTAHNNMSPFAVLTYIIKI